MKYAIRRTAEVMRKGRSLGISPPLSAVRTVNLFSARISCFKKMAIFSSQRPKTRAEREREMKGIGRELLLLRLRGSEEKLSSFALQTQMTQQKAIDCF